MPRINLDRLLEQAARRPPSVLVFLPGEEAFLRDEVIRRILDRLVDPPTRDFNLDHLRGGDVSADDLASLLATPPMMAEYRAVVIRDAQGLANRAREVVERIVTAPPAGLLLIVAAAIPQGSKAAFYRSLESRCQTVPVSHLDPAELPGWLVQRAHAVHGRDLEVDGARALSSAIGADLGILAMELQKAVDFVGEEGRVTLADIRAIGGYIPRVDRWAWFDRVAACHFAGARSELPTLLAAGETGVALVVGLTGQFLRIAVQVAGGTDALDRVLKPNQRWLSRRIGEQARRWTIDALDEVFKELRRTDRLLKSASLTDHQALEELLLRVEQVASAIPARAAGGGG